MLYNIAVPLLLIVGLFFSSGVFGFTMVKDRKDDLRYLLNCTGASSFAYLLGISLADSLLLLIPVSTLLVTGILS